MNKKLLTGILVTTAVLGTAVLALTPNGNDKILNPNTTYTNYTLTQGGTVDDPVVIWGNGAHVQCVLVQADYVIIRDLVVHNCTTFGIRANGKGIQILNNTVYDTVKANQLASGKCNDGAGASWHSALRAADASDIVISGNKVYESCGEGISILRADNVTVENNIVYDTFSVNIYCDQCSNATIRNNYSYSTGNMNFYRNGKVARSISIGAESYSGWAFNVHDILIEGNTLENVRGINYIQEQAGTPSNVIVRDNVFINVAAPLVNLGTWATVSNNIIGGTPTAGNPTPTRTATPSRTPAPATVTPAIPTVTRTATPIIPTRTASPVPATNTPVIVPTSTALCVPALSVWVCDKKP